MKYLALISLWLLFLPGLFSQNEKQDPVSNAYAILDSIGEVCFTFVISSHSQLEYLTRVVSIDKVNRDTVTAYANKDEFTNFLKYKLPFRLVNLSSQRGDIKTGMRLKGIWNWDTYPTYTEYDSMMTQFEEDYPDMCKIYSIGTLSSGRELLFAHLSSNINQNISKPQFMYSATIHGDETTGYVLMLRLIYYLLSEYGVNDQVTHLMDSLDIWINPLTNPDGTYAGGNNTLSGAHRGNANYVDCNRNFPDPQDGQHPDGYAWQPEVIAMMNFTDTMRFILSANFHGGAEVINYPWDTWYRRHADDAWLQNISRRYADSAHANSPAGYLTDLNNGITNGYDWYTISGGKQDYMTYFKRCREITMEISETKMVSASSLPNYWSYNRASFLGYMEYALKGLYGVVHDEEGNYINAEIGVEGLDVDIDHSSVYSDSTDGRFYRMLLPGSYNISAIADGFSPRLFSGVTIVDSARTFLDITMFRSRDYIFAGTVVETQNGYPIPQARVQIMNIESTPVFTDENGKFEIPGIQPDSYYVKVSRPEFLNQFFDITITEVDTVEDFTLSRTDAMSFEYGMIDTMFDNSGTHPWIIDSLIYEEGWYSISSDQISDEDSSIIEISAQSVEDDSVSFFVKVQSEGLMDFLNFYIDGSLRDQWSGEQAWQYVSYPVTGGHHTYKWKYIKDEVTSYGLDRAWIDYIILPKRIVDKVNVDGFVYDSNSMNPLSGATVKYIADSVYEQTTDITGYYNFPGIPAGVYYYAIKYDDYDSISGFINVESVNISKSFYLKRLIDLKGLVVNEQNDEVIEGANITISGEVSANISTGADGTFRLFKIPQGNYHFNINNEGYQDFLSSRYIGLYDTFIRFSITPLFTIDFENELPENIVQNAGIAEWYRDSLNSYEGMYSLRSGMISDNDSSVFILGPLDVISDGELRFYLKTSTEADGDKIEFYINGSLQYIESGENEWSLHEYPIYKGINDLKWVYVKNDLLTFGEDAVWIDFITMPQIDTIKNKYEDSIPDKGVKLIVYPNPVDGNASVSLQLSRDSYVIIKIYNLCGSEVWSYTHEALTRGIYDVPLPVTSLSKGMYICKIKTIFGIESIKFIKIE
ncbi:MAG: carboxypeptidase regulatory-like domain-containing protein [Bacteroidales bacterium]|nr:carboxypeptidase regulatory-like domain-containing protein [Bacteroidales bacterium]